MRVIIKPMGFALIIVSFAILAALLLIPMGNSGKLTSAGKSQQLLISLAPDNPDRWEHSELVPHASTLVETDLTNGPGGNKKGAKLTVNQADPSKSWHVQIYRTLADTFEPGQSLTLRFWARSAVSKTIKVVFEQNHDPYGKDLEQAVPLTGEWKQFTYTFRTTRPYPSKDSKLGFQVGEFVGDFEFTGVELIVN